MVQIHNNSLGKFKYRLVVGPYGDFTTIAAAVAWFNANATQDTTIQLDDGDFPISDTIIVNNATWDLQIIGTESSTITAATGLTGKAMFDIRSNANIRQLIATGSTLTSYGTVSGEDFVKYTTNACYSEICDVLLDTFYCCVHDEIGTDMFMMDFTIANCVAGTTVEYASSPGWTTMKEWEMGTFDNCTTGFYLKQAYLENFVIGHCLFLQTSGGQKAVNYDGTNYHADGICNIIGCSYNNTGTFLYGFDFTRADGRDANIEVMACVGTEDKGPHGKINVVDSTATTTLTAANTYYKANMNSKKTINFDQAATSGNFTITIGGQTTANIAWNASAATIQTDINNLSNVTACTVTQITAAKTWTIEFTTTGEGWLGMMPVVNLGTLSPTTSADVTPDTYSCKFAVTNNKYTLLTDHKQDIIVWVAGSLAVDNANRSINVGIKKNGTGLPLGPITVRAKDANTPTAFATIVYIEDMVKNDYFEIFISSANAGDVVTVTDVTLFMQSQ